VLGASVNQSVKCHLEKFDLLHVAQFFGRVQGHLTPATHVTTEDQRCIQRRFVPLVQVLKVFVARALKCLFQSGHYTNVKTELDTVSTSVGHNRYISIIELIEIIALYNRMIIRIVRL
jgi:hypothetical protein